MAKGLIQHIIDDLKQYNRKVLLVENNDRFLYRSDIQEALGTFGVEINDGTIIEQRIRFELKEPDGWLVLLCQDNSNYLEDIKRDATSIEFSLCTYLNAFHIPSVKELDISILDKLFKTQPSVRLNKIETQRFINQYAKSASVESPFDLDEWKGSINSLMDEKKINWAVVSRFIAEGLVNSIGNPNFEELFQFINQVNNTFQVDLQKMYPQAKNSSAVKKPRIVSKILDYLNFNYREEKTALIVVDGMALWQYELLRERLPGKKHESIIYAWLPSITQLSRQAIFRGDHPRSDYSQCPANEKKLWKAYWKEKGYKPFEVDYQHKKIDLSNLGSVSKLAIVFNDLDVKMHSSTDYVDLLGLTKNWIDRSEVILVVEDLISKGFLVFLTTDHGNIQARGWRGLTGREKLGTNKSGSRSERHIEYTERWLADEFIEKNIELANSLVMEEEAIYLKTDVSFSNKKTSVSHGGSHLLEVLIPFIKIMK